MRDSLPGRYRLLRRIGAGGMAEVFRAELLGAEGISRELVVKKIHPALTTDPAAIAMFVNEARIAARLRHPNVVQVYEFGRAGDAYFLAMELVEGCDLAAVIRACGGAPVPPSVAAYVILELLDGCAYVHELTDASGAPLGLVHRDISPHNVLLSDAGEVKLADFGIAKASAIVGHETAPQGVRGKFAYMPPEQALGQRLDARADLFAVGAMLYELLSGRRPYIPRPDGDLIDAVREGRIAPVRTVAPELAEPIAAVVAQSLSADREARYPTARAFRADLVRALDACRIRPDEDALREMVSRASRNAQSGGAPRADRTLTVPEDPPPETLDPSPLSDPEPVLPALAETPSAPPAAPVSEADDRPEDPTDVDPSEGLESPAGAPSLARRRGIDATALVIGVVVLSVMVWFRLSHTRVSPAPRAPATAPARTVIHLGVPEDPRVAPWLAAGARAAMEARCECEVVPVVYGTAAALGGLLREGQVEIALTDSMVVPALVTANLVRRLDRFMPEVDPQGYMAVRWALRPELANLGRTTGQAGEGVYFLPAVVDVVALALRPSEVRAAADGFAARREGLDARLRALTGHGLPAGFVLHPDPYEWTSWDLFAVAWSLKSSDADGGRVWLPLAADRTSLLSWVARAATSEPDESRGVTAGVGARTTLAWDVAMRAVGVLHPSVGGVRSASDALADRSVALAVTTTSVWARSPADGTTLVRLPRGDSFELDAAGDPARIGVRVSTGEAIGWVVSRGAAARETGRMLVAALDRGAVGTLAARWPALPVRADTEHAADAGARFDALTEYASGAMADGRFGVVSGPSSLDAVDRALARPARAFARVGETVFARRQGRWDEALIQRIAREGFE